MELKAEIIQANWEIFLTNIEEHISSPRKENLLAFYKKFEERIVMMPASHKKEYHNAFPGGYVDHVNRVVRCALKQYELWKEEGADISTFTIEELVFSALNHDLGKIGDSEHESTFNEMVAIQTHDGLYDPANEKYLKSFMPETKPRTSLPFIVHQADMMAARIEFEQEWLPKFSNPEVKEKIKSNNKTNIKTKALGSIKSEGLKDMLNSL